VTPTEEYKNAPSVLIKFQLLLEACTDSESALECKLNVLCCYVPKGTVFFMLNKRSCEERLEYSQFQFLLIGFEKPEGKCVFTVSDTGTNLSGKVFHISPFVLSLEEACVVEELPVILYILWTTKPINSTWPYFSLKLEPKPASL
jgi:hypothetical protein